MLDKKLKKVTILTGFLGSGKTTFLNSLLSENKGIRYAIIENEFGEESIDGELIVKTTDSIVEMNNGCLCCSLNENLYEILTELHKRRDEFDELIIESTGIADPTGIAEPFLLHPAIKNTFLLKSVICLVDAEQIEDQLKETEEAKKQIAFSSILLINKSDLVSDSYVLELQKQLSEINPLAIVIIGNKENFPDAEMINGYDYVEQTIVNTCHPHEHLCAHGDEHEEGKKHHHHHHHHHRHTDITSLTFRFKRFFNVHALHLRLLQFLSYQAKDVYRMKGIVYDATTYGQAYLIQSVGKRLYIEQIDGNKGEDNKISRIVFIGYNLNPGAYEKLLDKCLGGKNDEEFLMT